MGLNLQSFNDFKVRFDYDKYFRFRTIAVSLAVLLGICCVLMTFSLFSALFGGGFFPAGPGLFFVRPFGIFSLLIPLYLGYAVFILADPRWRPDRVFVLSVFIIPFMTLVVGFSLIRDYDAQAAQSAFLYFTGKTGFGLLIIFITVIEALIIQIARKYFYYRHGYVEIRRKKSETLSLPAPFRQDSIDIDESELVNISNDIQENNTLVIDEIKTDEESNNKIDAETVTSDASSDEDEDADETAFADETSINIKNENVKAVQSGEMDAFLRTLNLALEEAEAVAAIHAENVRKKIALKSKYKKYIVPIDILNEYPDGEYWVIDQATRDAAIALRETLQEFKIQAEVTGIRKGPVITMFEILPAPGVKLSKIVGLQDNIALRLAASSVRIVAPIPGKHAVGIEVPNAKRNIVSFREIIEGELQNTEKKREIPVVMGKDIQGEAQTVDLVQMPHLLIAGATGSGKSVCVNSIILSILYQLHPADCKLMLIDPKIVELKLYNDVPHLLTPVITEPKKAFQALQYCIYEMERRYACLDSVGVRDIRSYNRRIREKNIAQEHMPYIVIIIDEFADLMSTTGKELESTVARLAAMSRAVGIHLVLATQRPSIDVITGLIKANIPSRIAFMVASKMDSRIIIDMVGAEKLLGKGDMLYSGVVDPFPTRMQGAFISEEEVENVVEYVKTLGEPDYIDDEIFFDDEEEENGASLFSEGDDPLYEKALEIVHQQGKASASYIQRRLKIGFNRAARLVDEMEHNGVVGPAQGSKPRELLRGA